MQLQQVATQRDLLGTRTLFEGRDDAFQSHPAASDAADAA
jgi:hypothetical protein